MVFLQALILCIGVASFGVSSQEGETKTFTFDVPPGQDLSDIDLNQFDLGSLNVDDIDKSKIRMEEYTVPGKKTYSNQQPQQPGTYYDQSYDPENMQPQQPGTYYDQSYEYQQPGTYYDQPYDPGNMQQPVTGVYYIINVIYNYFAVGGRLTGIPPIDLLLLRYYVAQGPRNFCPKK